MIWIYGWMFFLFILTPTLTMNGGSETSFLWDALPSGGDFGWGVWESITFSFFVLLIGSLVMVFSNYYMGVEEQPLFLLFISLFIISMILLVSGSNPLSMFLGWEGVGVLSFLLIGWYKSREEAQFGAKKAVLMNRFSDFFFFLLFLSLGSIGGSGENIFSPLMVGSGEEPPSLVLISSLLMLSIIGKSAQFVFHPWLTSAMEGPTPVSALLHSSTMVVAGVFLLTKVTPWLFVGDSPIQGWLIGSSLLTMCLTSSVALFFKDIKKVVALSTTSQLAFMMFLLSAGLKTLALMHIFLHGFFKALLFLSAGGMIHQNGDQQDSRAIHLGGNRHPLLLLLSLFASLGLMGLPFVGAFFSKHVVMGAMNWGVGENLNFFIQILFVLGVGLSVAYGGRMLIFLISSPSRSSQTPLFSPLPPSPPLILPTICLMILTFGGGGLSNYFSWGEGGSMSDAQSSMWILPMLLLGGSLSIVFLGSSSKLFLSYLYSSSLIRLLYSSLWIWIGSQLEFWFEKPKLQKSLKNLGGKIFLHDWDQTQSGTPLLLSIGSAASMGGLSIAMMLQFL